MKVVVLFARVLGALAVSLGILIFSYVPTGTGQLLALACLLPGTLLLVVGSWLRSRSARRDAAPAVQEADRAIKTLRPNGHAFALGAALVLVFVSAHSLDELLSAERPQAVTCAHLASPAHSDSSGSRWVRLQGCFGATEPVQVGAENLLELKGEPVSDSPFGFSIPQFGHRTIVLKVHGAALSPYVRKLAEARRTAGDRILSGLASPPANERSAAVLPRSAKENAMAPVPELIARYDPGASADDIPSGLGVRAGGEGALLLDATAESTGDAGTAMLVLICGLTVASVLMIRLERNTREAVPGRLSISPSVASPVMIDVERLATQRWAARFAVGIVIFFAVLTVYDALLAFDAPDDMSTAVTVLSAALLGFAIVAALVLDIDAAAGGYTVELLQVGCAATLVRTVLAIVFGNRSALYEHASLKGLALAVGLASFVAYGMWSAGRLRRVSLPAFGSSRISLLEQSRALRPNLYVTRRYVRVTIWGALSLVAEAIRWLPRLVSMFVPAPRWEWVLKVQRRFRQWATPLAPEWRQRDGRQPVLFLRSFGDDELVNKTDKDSSKERFEEIVVHDLWRWGPVVALGRPNELLPLPGALREYAMDDVWRKRITELIHEARLIVFILGDTPGLAFELKRAVELNRLDRVIIMLPQLPGEELVKRRAALCDHLEVNGAGEIAARLRDVDLSGCLALAFRGDQTVVYKGKERDAYLLSLDLTARLADPPTHERAAVPRSRTLKVSLWLTVGAAALSGLFATWRTFTRVVPPPGELSRLAFDLGYDETAYAEMCRVAPASTSAESLGRALERTIGMLTFGGGSLSAIAGCKNDWDKALKEGLPNTLRGYAILGQVAFMKEKYFGQLRATQIPELSNLLAELARVAPGPAGDPAVEKLVADFGAGLSSREELVAQLFPGTSGDSAAAAALAAFQAGRVRAAFDLGYLHSAYADACIVPSYRPLVARLRDEVRRTSAFLGWQKPIDEVAPDHPCAASESVCVESGERALGHPCLLGWVVYQREHLLGRLSNATVLQEDLSAEAQSFAEADRRAAVIEFGRGKIDAASLYQRLFPGQRLLLYDDLAPLRAP